MAKADELVDVADELRDQAQRHERDADQLVARETDQTHAVAKNLSQPCMDELVPCERASLLRNSSAVEVTEDCPEDSRMLWWFERHGVYTRYEVLQLPTGTFELRVVDPDGTEHTEHIATARELAARQVSVERELRADGWTGPHGWEL